MEKHVVIDTMHPSGMFKYHIFSTEQDAVQWLTRHDTENGRYNYECRFWGNWAMKHLSWKEYKSNGFFLEEIRSH